MSEQRSSLSRRIKYYIKFILSFLRERRLRIHSPLFILSPTQTKAATPLQRRVLKEIREKGMAKIENMIDPDTLKRMQKAMAEITVQADKNREKIYAQVADAGEQYNIRRFANVQYDPDNKSCYYDDQLNFYACNDAFRFSKDLLNFALNKDVISVVNSYLGREACLARAISLRHLPAERDRGYYAWAWHHDGWGPKVNFMILLSEVGENDQYMSYKLGTHKRYHGYRGFQNSYSEEIISTEFSQYPEYKCLGKPGDVFMFDSNALHTANSKRDGSTREIFLLMFYSDRTFVFGQTLPADALNNRSKRDLRPFSETMIVNKELKEKNDISIRPTLGANWDETLPRIRHWLF